MKNSVIYAFLACLLFSCTIHTDPGQGQKVGKIVKLSRQGLIYKTWEGELIRGGFQDGSGVMGAPFHFTIEDERLLPIAQKAFEDQSDVIVFWRRECIVSICRAESLDPYFVEDIKVR